VDIDILQQKLGVSFHDTALLKRALAHSSFTNENPEIAPLSNERLEFLGDAVLGQAVATKLYRDFPHLSEGEMTKLRAMLVRRDALARIARSIELGKYLYLGKGEEASGGRKKPANLACALEAVIGAVFLNQGLNTTELCIERLFNSELERALSQPGGTDYKSELQEFIQAKRQQLPSYHVIETSGPDHNKRFTVEVKSGDTILGKGSGRSKKVAENEAAHASLKKLHHNFTR